MTDAIKCHATPLELLIQNKQSASNLVCLFIARLQYSAVPFFNGRRFSASEGLFDISPLASRAQSLYINRL